MLSSSITRINGASKVFNMGLVTYSNQSKKSVLKIPAKILKKYGSVSKECCSSMVNNLDKINKNALCVAVTGIAGPGGGSKKKPIGLVYIGLKKASKVNINKCLFKNKGRSYIQKITVRTALNLIIKFI